MPVTPDTLCPECKGPYNLLTAHRTVLRKRCRDCGHVWLEEATPYVKPSLRWIPRDSV